MRKKAIIATRDLPYGKKLKAVMRDLGFDCMIINEAYSTLRELVQDLENQISLIMLDEEMGKIESIDMQQWIRILYSQCNSLLITKETKKLSQKDTLQFLVSTINENDPGAFIFPHMFSRLVSELKKCKHA